MACEQGSDYSRQIYPFNKYSKHVADYCQKTFGKYIVNAGEWTLHNNSDLIDAGIFVFEKQGQIEIVSLTHNDINGRVDLDRGTSILGHSTPDYKVDEHTVFKATNGTIDLIKVMSILNASNVIGPNAKVMAVYSHNIWEGKGMPCYLDQLYKNWEILCQKYGIENNLKGSQFANPVEYALMTVGGIVKSNGTSFFTKQELDIEFSADTIVDAQESIQYLIRKLID
jgi:hypothetical protein